MRMVGRRQQRTSPIEQSSNAPRTIRREGLQRSGEAWAGAWFFGAPAGLREVEVFGVRGAVAGDDSPSQRRSCWVDGLGSVRAGVGLAVVAVIALAGALLLAGGRAQEAAPVRVMVAGRPLEVAPGTTLATVAIGSGLRPRAGDLLAVHGRVLRSGVFHGDLLVNGRPASGRRQLYGGDRVVAVDGRDRTEKVTRTVVREPGGVPSDPEFFVDRVPGAR